MAKCTQCGAYAGIGLALCATCEAAEDRVIPSPQRASNDQPRQSGRPAGAPTVPEFALENPGDQRHGSFRVLARLSGAALALAVLFWLARPSSAPDDAVPTASSTAALPTVSASPPLVRDTVTPTFAVTWPFGTSGDGSPAVPGCQRDLRALQADVVLVGEFTNDACVAESYGRYHAVMLEGRMGDLILVALSAIQFDPYLSLAASDGTVLSVDDDGGGALNASLQWQFSESGVLWVIVSKAPGGGSNDAQGSYELRLTMLQGDGERLETNTVGGVSMSEQSVRPSSPAPAGNRGFLADIARRLNEEVASNARVVGILPAWRQVLRGRPEQMERLARLLGDERSLSCAGCGVTVRLANAEAGYDDAGQLRVPGTLVVMRTHATAVRPVTTSILRIWFVFESDDGGNYSLKEVELAE